ncbi:glucan 1,4-alpha-glucosidase [Brevundimonas sp.]|uniref:glucan 1,4-alpha-glucosidase n=1 Tax=Brevundimonas sp. TaxID=1871086 RepID=UPI0025E0DA81|nr:glucan 1,4-alpha-glucosidase [Brevundimonas sp.]
MSLRAFLLLGCSAALLSGCASARALLNLDPPPIPSGVAPAAGDQPVTRWAYAAKTAVGASYEAYVDGEYRDGGPTGAVSRVWFSVADGVLTETMYGLVHEAQIRRMRIAVRTASGLVVEGDGTTATTEYLHTDSEGRPLSPAYRIVTRDPEGRVEIEKRVFTDPDRQSLVLRVTVRSLGGDEVTPFLLLEPHMANTGVNDAGSASTVGLNADEGGVHLTLAPSRPFERASVNWLADAESLADLRDGVLSEGYATTGANRGPLMLSAQLETTSSETTYDLAIGFGATEDASRAAASGSLSTGYDEALARYNGEGDRTGWEDYLASLDQLPRLSRQAEDGGRLLYASALALKVQEDRTYAGALIASLSNPWGDTASADRPATGYKAVWPRDFYQCAMALAALGDRETPLAAFRYLPRVQVSASTPGYRGGATGWFLQKSEVDGTPEWVAVQLDQTAMPIMLAYRLSQFGWLDDESLHARWDNMLRPAANFLVAGGDVDIDWNTNTIRPPFTQQERWEEQGGHSPSTTAAVITGLIAAAELADRVGDTEAASQYRETADRYETQIEALMFTTEGSVGDGRYYLRINTDEDPNNHSRVESRNGQDTVAEDAMIDAGFLELVRYGVRRADDPHVLESLAEVDGVDRPDLTRIRYDFTWAGVEGRFPGWRRYGVDGYGEDTASGSNYGAGDQMRPGQRGRVWPIFTGERGHYQLALALLDGVFTETERAAIRSRYVRAMELFANDGLLISEQVWDGVGVAPPHGYQRGEGTQSATPLAWSHAEYVKLLRSLADGEVWDGYAPVRARYGSR